MLFPKTLDYYQVELTRMLETERYGEATSLLEFLLQCQGEDPRHYEEWGALLVWLKDAFPQEIDSGIDTDSSDEREEDIARRHAMNKLAEDQDYANKLLKTATATPMTEHTFLALEQLAYIDRPEIDEALLEWLERKEVHPLLQYRVLQTLRRRGLQGTIKLFRGQEKVEIELENMPLTPADFPAPFFHILDRVGDQTQVHEPTLFYFAQELWQQFMMGVYGTSIYNGILSEEDSTMDIWAAVLHQTVVDTLHDGKSDEEIRSIYGITDAIRLRYEQALRMMKQFISIGLRND